MSDDNSEALNERLENNEETNNIFLRNQLMEPRVFPLIISSFQIKYLQLYFNISISGTNQCYR